MAEILLHCGIPKTASSSIQRTLNCNQEILLASGVLYPFGGRARRKSPAHYAIHHAMVSDRTNGVTSETQKIATEIEDEITQTGVGQVVISCEMLSFIQNKEIWSAFLGNLKRHTVQAVYYFRDPEAWIKSWHRQAVKFAFNRNTFQEFRREIGFPFEQSVDSMRSVLGNNSVRVFDYDKLTKEFGIVEHFVALLKNVHIGDLSLETGENITPSLDDLAKLRRFNLIEDLSTKQRRQISEALMKPISAEERLAFE